MEEHIYRYGSIYDARELMKRATGNETEVYDFLNYLESKYGAIYFQ
jgi:carboxypeptidase Taq